MTRIGWATRLCVLLMLCASSSANNVSPRFLAAECHPVGECSVCTGSDRKNYPLECMDTGKIQRIECQGKSDDESVSTTTTKRESCKRTKTDDEFAMLQLQVCCFFIGSLAFMQVRKQKRLSASLFDQRKFASRRPTIQDEDETEMVEFSRRNSVEEESVPLMTVATTTQNPLEVV